MLENEVEMKNDIYAKQNVVANSNSNISSSSSVPSEYISTTMQQTSIHRATTFQKNVSNKLDNDMGHSLIKEQRNNYSVTKTEKPGQSILVCQLFTT